MKIWTAIGLSVVVLIGCNSSSKSKEFGSIKGNVYWKYNNFVGNRPDAGSLIWLYKLGEDDLKYQTTADVRGDYFFDSIPAGPYLMIIKSNDTKSSAHDQFIEVYSNILMLDTTFNVNTKSVVERYKEVISAFVDKAQEGLLSDNKNSVKDYDRYMDSVRVYSEKAMSEMPDKLKSKLLMFGTGSPKIDIKGVYVNNKKTENIVTDFGITYF